MIALREVTKRFDDRVALDGVSIEVLAGTVHALLGSSGSGKSTVLRLILGVVEPDLGEVLVDGTPVTGSTRAALVRSLESARAPPSSPCPCTRSSQSFEAPMRGSSGSTAISWRSPSFSGLGDWRA